MFPFFLIGTKFSLLSPLSLSFLSVQRCMVIVFPLNIKNKNRQFVAKWLTGIITSSAIFVIVMCALVKYSDKMIPLTTCTPFVNPTNFKSLIKIITRLVVILQFGATFIIIIAYSILVKKLHTSDKPFFNQSFQKEHISVILQIIILTVSNIICWIPSGIIYLTLILLDKYPIDITVLAPIVITSINSIINPIIFSIASRHGTL